MKAENQNLITTEPLLFKGNHFKGQVTLAGTKDFPTTLVSLMGYEVNEPPHYLCTIILRDYVPNLTINQPVYFNLIEENKRIYACNLIENDSDGIDTVPMNDYDFYQRGAFNMELLNVNNPHHSNGHTHDPQQITPKYHNNKHRLSFRDDLG